MSTHDLSGWSANDHPWRIIICSATGDWIEWERPELPQAGDCPHGGCDCTPTPYMRFDHAASDETEA